MHSVAHFFINADPLLVYLIVAVVLLLESAAIPIANNTLLLFTGALASLGRLNIWELAIAAIVGSVIGACLAYVVGLRGGQHFLLRIVAFLHLDSKKVVMAERWCRKSGMWMIFFSRMTPYVRPFACFPAGISRMPFPRFFASASSGSLIWCSTMLTIGWYLGRRWVLAVQLMQRYTVLALGIVAALIVIYLLLMYIVKRRLHLHYQPVSREV